MKMSLKINDLFVGGGEMVETDMGVGDPRIIIHHLVKSVYQYPKITMVQEIASNARDANVESGNPDVPIQIQVPSTLDNNLIISDHGIGISPHRMHTVFVLIGNSTKREDDKSDGTFGIGSKIPLAYTDQFTVKTVVREDDNLVRRLYAVVKRDDFSIKLLELGEPHIVNSSDPEGDQHTGTSITIPVKPEDFGEVRNAVLAKTEFWKVRPTITGAAENELTYPERNWMHRCEAFDFVMSSRCYESELYAVVNGIKYPIHSSVINNKAFAGNIFLHFGIGELLPTLNRESLQIDDDAKIKINNRFNEALATIKEHLFRIIDSQKTYLDAWNYVKLLRDANWLDSHTDVTWNGVRIVYSVSAPKCNAFGDAYDKKKMPVSCMTFAIDYDNKMCGKKYDSAQIEMFVNMKKANIPVFYTSKTYDVACIKFAFSKLGLNWRNQQMVIFKGARHNVDSFLSDNNLEEVIPTMFDIDTCGYVKAKRVKGQYVRPTKTINKWKASNSWRRKFEVCGEFDYDNNDDHGYYFLYDKKNDHSNAILGNGRTMDNRSMHDVQSAFKIQIVGVAPGNVKFLNPKNWKPLHEIVDNDDVMNDIETYQATRGSNGVDTAVDNTYIKIDPNALHADSPMRLWLEAVIKFKQNKLALGTLYVDGSCCTAAIANLKRVKVINETTTPQHEVVRFHNQVTSTYPMMKYLTLDKVATKDLLNYIMLVDAANGLK
jgi:hypothetical protein